MRIHEPCPTTRGLAASVIGAMIASLLTACSGERSGTTARLATQGSAADSLALMAIGRVRGEEVNSLDPTLLETSPESSRVVPGLVYYRSVYRPSGSAHMESVVVLARRDTELVVLDTPEQFAAVSGHWFPDRAGAASVLCGELAKFVGRASTAVMAPLVFERGDDWRKLGFSPPGPPWRSRVGAPSVHRLGPEQWNVQLWVAEPGRVVRYECRLQPVGAPLLHVVDSIPGAGLPPENP